MKDKDHLNFSEIYKKYKNPLLGFIYKLTKDIYEAEDIVQELFAKLYSKGIFLNPNTDTTKSFLFKSAKNQAIDNLRKKGNKLLKKAEHIDNINEKFLTSSSAECQVEKIIKDEITDIIYNNVNKLDSTSKRIFLKKYNKNEPITKIEKDIQISKYRINKKIQNIKYVLKEALAGYNSDK